MDSYLIHEDDIIRIVNNTIEELIDDNHELGGEELEELLECVTILKKLGKVKCMDMWHDMMEKKMMHPHNPGNPHTMMDYSNPMHVSYSPMSHPHVTANPAQSNPMSAHVGNPK